jgi:hypothetical protein
MILVKCSGLSFHWEYIHVEAHQDECMWLEDLSRAAQLNATCNVGAKVMLCSQDIKDLPWQEVFSQEPICMFMEGTTMTSNMGAHFRYAVGRQVACSFVLPRNV